ncbi:serine/threonine protein kinase [Thermococcus sp. MV5]|uniref:serine/threonine protein kinase n=1 Tax=Thermococcus sp. MV5 TaxID=1638272 RepID=UPI001438940F|nr:serine/threonine protein kinase [Thermococcus sp. MV5]NJE26870.1 serine/threonine protein kinase [Thermococcus sp. MV5]
MINHLISKEELERFKYFMHMRGIENLGVYSKGTTSLIFLGSLENRDVIVKLERRDAPRRNFQREVKILRFLEGKGITPHLIDYGTFENREFLIREFAKGEPILYATPEKRHLLKILEKMYKLDTLGVDHGQIQGGKHIIIGNDVWVIDFEKASLKRKTKNLTSAMAMIFLNENSISRRVREKFEIDKEFLTTLQEELQKYKETHDIRKLKELLSNL